MLISLIVLTIVTVAALGLLLRRDRKFLRKPLKETVTEDMKKRLNLRHQEAHFDLDLQRRRGVSSKSKEILREMNDL
jgi:hypothetical protein